MITLILLPSLLLEVKLVTLRHILVNLSAITGDKNRSHLWAKSWPFISHGTDTRKEVVISDPQNSTFSLLWFRFLPFSRRRYLWSIKDQPWGERNRLCYWNSEWQFGSSQQEKPPALHARPQRDQAKVEEVGKPSSSQWHPENVLGTPWSLELICGSPGGQH